jgi:hypothetical protein
MGNSTLQPWLGRGAATGVFSRVFVETKGFELAPQVEQRVFHGGEILAEPLILNDLLKFAHSVGGS